MIELAVAISISVVATLWLIIGVVGSVKKSKQITHTDRPERQAEYMPEWKIKQIEEISVERKDIVTVCRNCGANLNGKAKCEYCGTVYPENMFLLIQKEDTEARKRADALLTCGLFHTELSEINDDIKHIQAEIERI